MIKIRQNQTYHLFFSVHFFPFQNLASTLPKMQFSHWVTSLEAIWEITCSFKKLDCCCSCFYYFWCQDIVSFEVKNKQTLKRFFPSIFLLMKRHVQSSSLTCCRAAHSIISPLSYLSRLCAFWLITLGDNGLGSFSSSHLHPHVQLWQSSTQLPVKLLIHFLSQRVMQSGTCTHTF